MKRFFCLALLGLSGCVRPPARPPAPFSAATLASYGRYHGVRADAVRADSTIVVFPFHPDDTLAYRPRVAGPLGPATLSPAEVQLTDSLAKATERAHHLPYAQYRYQYVAVVDGGGAKHVWVNGFCHAPPYWTTQVVATKGGGDCFYQVQCHLTTLRVTAFGTNAPK